MIRSVLMSHRLSVFSNANPSQVITDPYPYIVVKNALAPDIYAQLEREFPGKEFFANGRPLKNNSRYGYALARDLEQPRLTPLWREFFEYHVSPEFYQEVISLFGASIRKFFPDLEDRVGHRLEEFSIGTRISDRSKGIRNLTADVDVSMDCQFGINSPVTEYSSVRGPHVDNPRELFAALLYFRSPDDDSTGSDLEVYRYRKKNFVFTGKAELDDKYVELISTIKYEPNTLVFFVNSLYSLHGVSPRSVTPHIRRFINLAGDVQDPLFPIRRPLSWHARRAVSKLIHLGRKAPEAPQPSDY